MAEAHNRAAEQLSDRRFIVQHLARIDSDGVLQNLKFSSVWVDFTHAFDRRVGSEETDDLGK